jgi:hypothetical protein
VKGQYSGHLGGINALPYQVPGAAGSHAVQLGVPASVVVKALPAAALEPRRRLSSRRPAGPDRDVQRSQCRRGKCGGVAGVVSRLPYPRLPSPLRVSGSVRESPGRYRQAFQ